MRAPRYKRRRRTEEVGRCPPQKKGNEEPLWKKKSWGVPLSNMCRSGSVRRVGGVSGGSWVWAWVETFFISERV